MKRVFLLVFLMGSASVGASSADLKFDKVASVKDMYLTLRAPIVEEIVEDESETQALIDALSVQNDCSQMPVTPPFTSNGDDQTPGNIWDEIENVGRKIWKVISDNKPVVNVRLDTAHALPRGIVCWTDLDSWKAPKSKRFKVVYKNLFGMKVVEFSYRIIFNYGGGQKGKGQYIANATIVPATLNVLWGYTFNAEAKVGQVMNLGTAESPIAGMEMGLNWHISTVIKDVQTTVNYFMQGDGVLIQHE